MVTQQRIFAARKRRLPPKEEERIFAARKRRIPEEPEIPVRELPARLKDAELVTQQQAEAVGWEFTEPLPQGWLLRIKGGRISQITPEGFEITERYIYDPQGRQIDPEREAILRQREERAPLLAERVFPEADVLLQGMVVSPDMTEPDRIVAEKAQDDFILAIQSEGRTFQTEGLLRQLGASEEQIDEFFPEEEITPQAVLGLEPEWENIRTGEVITQSEKDTMFPKGWEPELDEWSLTAETGRNYLSVFEVFGKSLTKLPKQTGAAILKAIQGHQGASVVDKGWSDRWIENAESDLQQFAADVRDKYGNVRLPINVNDLATLPESMGFSFVSMGAGLAVGVPIALAPVPGARVGAWVAGTAASGAAAFNMASYQIMQLYLETKDDEMKVSQGRGLTLSEEDSLKKDFSTQAIKYGLWEAVPEALSNLAFARLLTLPLGKMVGRNIATKLITKVAGIYGEEFLTETITQKGQSGIEVEAGLREERITWVEAFKEIAPQTFLLTTILGGLGSVSVASVNRIKKSLKKEAGDSPTFDAIVENIDENLFNEVEAESATLDVKKTATDFLRRLHEEERGAIGKEVPGDTLPLQEISKYETRIPLDLIRKDEPETLARLTEEIKKEGIKEPIVIRVREDGSRIVWDGIHRLIVAQDLGIKNVPVKYIGEEGETLAPKVTPKPPTKPPAVEAVPEVTPEVTIKEISVGNVFRFEATHKDFPNAKSKVALSLYDNYSVLLGLNVEKSIQRKGIGSTLVMNLLDRAEQVGKPVIAEKVTQQGNALLKSMEAKGLIKLTPLSDEIDIGVGKMVDVGGGISLSASYQIERVAIPKTPITPAVEVKPLPPTKPVAITEVAPLPPEGATKRVFERIQIEPAEPSVKEKMRRGFHNFQVKVVDDLYAIKKFTEQTTKGGDELSIEENPYLLARLLKGVTSKSTVFLEQGTFGKKFWKIEKGKATPNFTGESLETILKDVQAPTQWRDFSTYLVSRRAVELSGRDIETGIELVDAQASITELESQYKNFPALAERVYKYQDNLMVYANEMGLVSKDLMTKLKKFGNYVPFYRVFNELQSKGFMGKKMANIASPIKRIKGSEREIINPLESIVKNTYTIINAADRNQVGIAMANLANQNPEIAELFERVDVPIAKVARVSAKELGVEIEGLSDEDAEKVVDIFRPSFFVRGDEVTVLINGEKAYFKVDPDVRDALLTLDRENIGLIGKVLGLPAKWLRAGATLSPDFMVRNPLRDQMTAFAYSNYGFLPGIDFMRGVAGIVRRDQDYQLFRLSGAEHSMMVSMDRQYLKKTFREIVEGKKFTDYVKRPLELFQIVSELGEKATRLGEFKGGTRRGAVPLEAGFSARSVSLDFAQAGTTARAVNRLIAFFNANIRGWGRMISSFKEHPTRTAFKVFVGITLPSILLYLANRDDPRWKEIPQWQKDLFWIVMTEDTIYRIPKPFELGIIFGSMPERFLEWLDNKDPEMLTEVMLNMAEAGSPGYIPTALLPIIENLANFSFFRGRSIVPASRKQMPPELQYTRWTGEFSKKVGELLNFSPAKIDNLINGWTGGLGRYATDILSGILKGTGISPDIPEPSPTQADIPVLKAFVVRNPFGSSSESVTTFYDKLEEYTQGEKFLKEMLSLGDIAKFEKFKASHPDLLFFHDFENDVAYSASARYLRKVARELSALRKKEDEIFKSKTMTSAEKRSLIDEIDKVRFEVARRALTLFPAEEPIILEKQLSEVDNKLGELIDDVPLLSLEEPDFYTTKKLSSDYSNILEAVPSGDIVDKKGVPKTVNAWYEKEQSESIQLSFVNTPIYRVDTDKELALLSKRQRELFRKYSALPEDKKDAFLEANPRLKENPRKEWLKANPIDNGRLAVWGQAKILSLEAYNEAKRLIDELDIPEDALPEFTLPPEGSVENYFKYTEQGEELGYNSWEVQLIIAQDNDLREFLGRQPIETPVRALELKIEQRGFIEGSLEHKEVEREVEALENNFTDKAAGEWVERGKVIDEFGASSAEAKLWLLDHPVTFREALNTGLLIDDGSEWDERILRIDVELGKLSEESDEFRDLSYKRDAISKDFPDNLIDTYVDWYETKRSGWDDDWFLQENKDFYNAMVTKGILQLRDFSKVPSKAIALKLAIYKGILGSQAKEDYRAQNPDLEWWKVNIDGLKPIGDRGDAGADISRQEKLSKDIAEGLARIKKLRE